MNAIALQEPVSKLRGPSLTALFPASHLSGCHLPERFQLSRSSCRSPWEPAMGSMAVIRTSPREGMLRRDARPKNWRQFRFFMSDPALSAMGIIFRTNRGGMRRWSVSGPLGRIGRQSVCDLVGG